MNKKKGGFLVCFDFLLFSMFYYFGEGEVKGRCKQRGSGRVGGE